MLMLSMPLRILSEPGRFQQAGGGLNLSIPIFSSSGTLEPGPCQILSPGRGTVYPYPVSRPTANLISSSGSESRFNRDPSPSSAYAYDAANMVIDAMRSGARSSEDFASYLASVKDYAGVSNIYDL